MTRRLACDRGVDACAGVVFGSGSHDNSVCPSLACLDIKMYNFLNSEACICTVNDLKRIRELAVAAQDHLKVTLIGARAAEAQPAYPTQPRPSSRYHGFNAQIRKAQAAVLSKQYATG